ncbi:MAG: CoA transferase [Alphaproteobacteria bacterium]|jgi:2-methylfumaryl-CoA isomerase
MYDLLDGMRILEGSAFVAAPLGGMTLAQLGAEVIRFDDVNGGLDHQRWPLTSNGDSIYWAGMNKGKRSILVDVRSAEGQELLSSIATAPGADAGIFLTNLPARGWSAYESLKAKRDDMIMVALTGARDGAPHVDYTVNAMTGFPMVTGPADHAGPVNNVLPAWDVGAGLTISTSLLAAERRRSRKGQGAHIKLSLLDVALWTTANLGYVGEAAANDIDRARTGNQIFGTFGQTFQTKDGQWVMLCMFTGRHVKAVKQLMGGDGGFDRIEAARGVRLEDEAARYEARAEIEVIVRPWISSRTYAEVAEALEKAGALWAGYQSFRQALDDPYLYSDNPMFKSVAQPGLNGAAFPIPGAPMWFEDLERLPPKPAPRFGEHTDQVLADVLGLGSGQIGALHDKGTVKGAI